MKYDFTTLPDRWHSSAEKFCNMRQKCPDVTPDILPFSVADMDFLPPPALVKGMQAFIGREILGYTLPSDSYYQAILDWMARRHGLKIPREWLVDADNVIGAMRQMICAYSQRGDQVITLSPVYPPFLFSVPALERELVECPMVLGEDKRYQIDWNRFEEVCSQERAKILLFCNPHNPVGKAWSREELERVAEICLRHHVFIISDEIHWDLILPGTVFTSMASLSPEYQANCAVSTAATKTFNIAALKGATIILADEQRRRDYKALNGVAGRGILSYVACEIAYRQCEDWLDELLPVLEDNRRLMAEFMAQRLPEVGVIPLEATYLQWLDFRFLNLSPAEQEDFMAQKARCFFTEGYKFGTGGAGFERWNLACPQSVLLAGLERMERAVHGR